MRARRAEVSCYSAAVRNATSTLTKTGRYLVQSNTGSDCGSDLRSVEPRSCLCFCKRPIQARRFGRRVGSKEVEERETWRRSEVTEREAATRLNSWLALACYGGFHAAGPNIWSWLHTETWQQHGPLRPRQASLHADRKQLRPLSCNTAQLLEEEFIFLVFSLKIEAGSWMTRELGERLDELLQDDLILWHHNSRLAATFFPWTQIWLLLAADLISRKVWMLSDVKTEGSDLS